MGAIDVCEEAYRGCSWDGNLMDGNFHAGFAKKELIAKSNTQPSPLSTGTGALFPPQDLLGLGTAPSTTSIFPGSTPISFLKPPQSTGAPNPNEPVLPAGFVDGSYNALACLGELSQQVRSLSMSEAGYSWLNEQALARLDKKDQVDTAFHLFRLANDLHIQLHGLPCPTTLYNMACCEAVAVSLQVVKYHQVVPLVCSLAGCSEPPERAGGLVAPEMPPRHGKTGTSVGSLCEARLDAALGWLRTAIGAGYHQHAHMLADPDLQALRELRGPSFHVLVGLANTKP